MKRTVLNIAMSGIIGMFIVLSLGSCEDVIEVDVPSEAPRLIVDALIRVDTSVANTFVRVKVSETTSFFDSISPADIQQITLSNLDNPGMGDSGILLETTPGSGEYGKFFSTEELMNDTWFLQIDYNDEIYVATSRFVPTVPFDSVVQGDEILFEETDTELIVSFTDFPDREDYYLFDFDFGNFLGSEDTFYEGQSFSFSYFYDEELVPWDEVTVSIMGIDEDFYVYMNQLIEQSNQISSPFETPTVTVRGNIINATEIDNNETFNNLGDVDNFALGYFAIVHEFQQSIIIQ